MAAFLCRLLFGNLWVQCSLFFFSKFCMAILQDFLTDKAKQEWCWKLQCCREYKQLTRKVIEVNRLYISHFSYPVYTIEPVVKLVVQPVWQPAVSCKQTSSRLSNRLSNTTGLTTVLNEQPLFVQLCWTNSHCSFNRSWNRVVQPVYNRLYTRYSQLSDRFDNQVDNRFNNRLCRVNGASGSSDSWLS